MYHEEKMLKASCIVVLLCLVFLVCGLTTFSSGFTPKVDTKHDGEGGLTITIDLNVNSDKKAKHEKPNVVEGPPKVDSLSKKAATIIESSVSSKDATQISENLLILANEIRNIANLIPSNEGQEKKDLKDQLTVIVSNLVQQAETPKALLLESSLALVAQKKHDQEVAASTAAATTLLEEPSHITLLDRGRLSRSHRHGAKTLIIPTSPLDWVALGLNVVDDIGTYSQKFNKMGEFMSGPVAQKLDKWNMKSLANISKNTGGTISTYSKKLEPYEQKAAKFIAPVVKSQTFQVVKKSVNVVSGVLGVHGGLKSLNLIKGGGVKLPTNYAALKTSLSTAVTKSNALIKNAKTFVTSTGKVTKIVGASKQMAKGAVNLVKLNGSQFKAMSKWDKVVHVDGLKGAYDSVKDLKEDFSTVKNKVTNRMNQPKQQKPQPKQQQKPISRNNGRSQPKQQQTRNTSRASNNNQRNNRSNNNRSSSNNNRPAKGRNSRSNAPVNRRQAVGKKPNPNGKK